VKHGVVSADASNGLDHLAFVIEFDCLKRSAAHPQGGLTLLAGWSTKGGLHEHILKILGKLSRNVIHLKSP
jgi:hypothetical protein